MIKKNILKMILLSVFIFTLLAGSALTAMASMSPGLMKAGSKTTFPAAFDLRTEGHVSFVRNSAGDGTGNWQKGWAFAVMASLESRILSAPSIHSILDCHGRSRSWFAGSHTQ